MSESTEKLWSEYSLVNEKNPAQKHRWRIVVREAQRALGRSTRPRIADFGCGSGALLAHVAKAVDGASLVGIDAEPLALRIAAGRLPEATFVQADLETPSEAAIAALVSGVDIVLCSEVLEHLERPARAVQLAARTLRPEGHIVVTVPSGPMTAFDKAIGHRHHYTLEELDALLVANGFRILRSYRWGFPFHTLFRIAMQLAPSSAAGFGDSSLSAPKRALLASLDLLFRLNLRSRRVGRQLVAVGQRAIS